MTSFMPTKYQIAGLLVLALVWGFNAKTLDAQIELDLEGTDQYADMLPFPTDRITVPSWRYADGPHVRSAFREVVASASRATVRVRAEGKKTAMGAVVGSEGWILTKASRLRDPITCELADGRQLDARLVGVNREYDVALLKIEAKDLPTLQISETEVPPVGSWLATVGMGRDPLAVGVVSVLPREIPHRAGILGVMLGDHPEHALIEGVLPKSGAERAGLLANDIIASVDGIVTPNRVQLKRTLGSFSPGDHVKLEVKRGEEYLLIEAILMGEFPGMRATRDEFQNKLGGSLSQRRFGFPSAFQHDTVVDPSDCGGPIVNLDGQVVGFNIARSGRTETYALATADVSKLLKELMAGELSEEPIEEEQSVKVEAVE